MTADLITGKCLAAMSSVRDDMLDLTSMVLSGAMPDDAIWSRLHYARAKAQGLYKQMKAMQRASGKYSFTVHRGVLLVAGCMMLGVVLRHCVSVNPAPTSTACSGAQSQKSQIQRLAKFVSTMHAELLEDVRRRPICLSATLGPC